MAKEIVQEPEVIYDLDSDMLRVQLGEADSTYSIEVAGGVVLDYDAEDRVVAIEIDGASWSLRDFLQRAGPIATSPSHSKAGDN
jgi:uncharacterized protein YuzE